MRYVTAKLGTMRKAQEFSVRPTSDGRILLQSDKSTGLFDFRTGRGVLNQKGTTFLHLNPACGAVPYQYPAEFVAECLEVCPALDSETVLAGGAVIMRNTVRMIGGAL